VTGGGPGGPHVLPGASGPATIRSAHPFLAEQRPAARSGSAGLPHRDDPMTPASDRRGQAGPAEGGPAGGPTAGQQTPATLPERLRHPDAQEAGRRFVDLYPPLLYHWARRTGLAAAEAADLVQDVLTVLVQKLPEFRYDPGKSFRAWLRTVTLNKWRGNRRRP